MAKKTSKPVSSQTSADESAEDVVNPLAGFAPYPPVAESEPGGAGALARTEVGAVGSADAQAGGGLADRLRPADPFLEEGSMDVDRGDDRGGEAGVAEGAIPEKGTPAEPAVSGQTVGNEEGQSHPEAEGGLATDGRVGGASGPAVMAAESLSGATSQPDHTEILGGSGASGEPAFLAGPLVNDVDEAKAEAEAVDDDFLVACVARYRFPTDFRCVRIEDRFTCGVLIWTEPCPRRAVPNIPLLDYNQVREWA